MLQHYLVLSWRSLRQHPALSALIMLTLAIGMAACMTTLTLFQALSGDPIPHKSARLFNVQLDSGSATDWRSGQPPTLQLTRFDGEALLREARGVHQVLMSGGGSYVTPTEAPAQPPFYQRTRYASADFFAMFEAPFLHGQGWGAEQDQAQARVAVISSDLNQRLFGGADSRGKTLRLGQHDFTISGVLQPWRPTPHYFDLTLGAYNQPADIYIPLSTALALRMSSAGNMHCWGDVVPDRRALNAPCAWLQYWVQLDTPEQARAYRQYLHDYSQHQREAGRFERPSNPRLWPLMQWLQVREVVPVDVRLQLWLAFGFLLVCLANAVGLQLAKCLRRSGEIGVRRALGATRGQVFAQFLVESASLGVAGGVLGLVLTWCGLALVHMNPEPYAQLARIDTPMLATTLALSLLASLLAGVLPAWRASQVAPALQLKTQ
ncbi:ABC transporter permease [Roseateles sp. BYS180W]|uniref:ABC transporter permease n=1 Tax=Roseateles rivi TaxID=3299028 RepID=A0ABW7FVI7_9BURK